MMKDIGDILSYGILFCMLAALTIVPSILVLLTKEGKEQSIKDKIQKYIKKNK